jgi:hypothetical protein
LKRQFAISDEAQKMSAPVKSPLPAVYQNARKKEAGKGLNQLHAGNGKTHPVKDLLRLVTAENAKNRAVLGLMNAMKKETIDQLDLTGKKKISSHGKNGL